MHSLDFFVHSLDFFVHKYIICKFFLSNSLMFNGFSLPYSESQVAFFTFTRNDDSGHCFLVSSLKDKVCNISSLKNIIGILCKGFLQIILKEFSSIFNLRSFENYKQIFYFIFFFLCMRLTQGFASFTKNLSVSVAFNKNIHILLMLHDCCGSNIYGLSSKCHCFPGAILNEQLLFGTCYSHGREQKCKGESQVIQGHLNLPLRHDMSYLFASYQPP